MAIRMFISPITIPANARWVPAFAGMVFEN